MARMGLLLQTERETAGDSGAKALRAFHAIRCFGNRLRRGWRAAAVVLVACAALAPGGAQAYRSQTENPPDSGASATGNISVNALPREAVNTLSLISAGGPFPFEKDGVVFGNFERMLPSHRRGYYHEYTVPTPRARNRGAKRIVCGGALKRTDNCYYSDDHYASFRRIID